MGSASSRPQPFARVRVDQVRKLDNAPVSLVATLEPGESYRSPVLPVVFAEPIIFSTGKRDGSVTMIRHAVVRDCAPRDT
jgi:hypothetical protein